MAEVIEHDHRPWWLRVRSAFLLTLLVVALGLATAVIVGVAALAVSQVFSQALG
jgi:hypothetical protein